MTVLSLAVYHCDLGPTNLPADGKTGSLGIIGWKIAGKCLSNRPERSFDYP